MNPPMTRIPEPGDSSLPTIYDSPLSREEREERIRTVADEQAKIVAQEVERTPGSFSYLTPEYRRDRAKNELDTYLAALDSIIKKNPSSEVAQIAEIIKDDLGQHFKKKLAILNEAMEKSRGQESDEKATKRKILKDNAGANLNIEQTIKKRKTLFVGKEIKKPDIQKVVAKGLKTIRGDLKPGKTAAENAEQDEKIKENFLSELTNALEEQLPEDRNVPGVWEYHKKQEKGGASPERIIFRTAGASLEGKDHGLNMDSYFVDSEHTAIGALDGLGSYADGASQFAAPEIQKFLAGLPDQMAEAEITQATETFLQVLNDRVIAELHKNGETPRTTASVAKVFTNEHGERKLLVANIGDSRVYVIRDGKIVYETLDQMGDRNSPGKFDRVYAHFIDKVQKVKNVDKKEAKRLVLKAAKDLDDDSPLLKNDDAIKNRLAEIGVDFDTEWEMGDRGWEGFRYIRAVQADSNQTIGEALGSAPLQPDFDITTIQPKDIVLAFTDGVNGNFTDEQILEMVANTNPALIPQKILDAVKENWDKGEPIRRAHRYKEDDVTVAVMEITGAGKVPSPKPPTTPAAASPEPAEPKAPSATQELIRLADAFDAAKKVRMAIKESSENEDALRDLVITKEPELQRLFMAAAEEKDTKAQAKQLEEIKILLWVYTKNIEALRSAAPAPVATADPTEKENLPVASPESLRFIPRFFKEGQVFFLPAEGESSRANWKIISRDKAFLELEQIDGTPVGRKIRLHAKDLQELLKDINKDREVFEKSELEKDREGWQKALAGKGVLRPKGEKEERGEPLFDVGQTVRFMYKGSLTEWEVKAVEKGVHGKLITLTSGDQEITLRASTLRKRMRQTEDLEEGGGGEPGEEIEEAEGERFYLGRSITIPDGEHQGVWHILSREDAGATLQKFGSDETFKINYEDLEKIIADYEALHPEAASGPDAKPEKISNPPVGQLISLFSQSRGDPKALYQGYLTWERNWITNHAIDNLREKRGNIAISNLQIENTKKVLGIYKKMLRLKAEGKNISIEGAEGSMLLMARILAGKHHDKFSDIKYLVESYRPETDAALIEKLEKRIANAEQGVAESEVAGEGGTAEKRAPQTIEEWVPVIRSDFDGLVARNKKFKEKLNDDDANELTDQENLVDGLIDRLEAIFAEVAKREARKEVLRKEITEAWARDEDPKEENDELDALLRLGSDVPKEAQTLSNEIYAAIQQYMQITKQKSKLIEAREKLQKSFQSRTAETPQAFAERDKARFDAEAEREKRVKKLLEEQHELMSGAKQAEGEIGQDGDRKMADYLDLYTERREIPGTNEVSYYLKSFGKDDPRTDIVRKMLKKEDDVLYVLMDTKRYPENKGKEIKLFFKETAPEEKYPTAKELFTENYSPAKELDAKRVAPKKKDEQPDTRTEAEKAAIGKIHTGDVPYETSPYTAGMVRPVYEQVKKLTAEQKQERAKTVGATLETLWKKYALGKDGLAWWKILAPLAVMSAVAGSGNEGGEKPPVVEGPAVATTLGKPWRSELSPEIETYVRSLSTKSISQIAAESVPSSDPNYVKNLLSAPAGPILYDNTAANPEGTLDADRIDHRKEASAILKQGESLARSIRQYLQKIQADPNLIQEATYLSEVLEKEKRAPREDEKEKRMTVSKYLDAIRALMLKTQS